MSNALVFDFDGEPARFVNVAGREAMIGLDAARCLGIENHRNVFARTPDNEKGVHTVDTLGGKQEVVVLFEPGIYRLIFESRKPAAERFKTWVFNEVLPTIRRTGGFGTPHLDVKATNAALALVRQAQRTFGQGKAQAIWIELGLPNPASLPTGSAARSKPRAPADATPQPRPVGRADVSHVPTFLSERCERDPAGRVRSRDFITAYEIWAAKRGLPPLPAKPLSRALDVAGVYRWKSNGTIYRGVRLLPEVAQLPKA